MKIDVTDIKKVDLKPGETLVVSIEINPNMPPSRRKKHMQAVADVWRSVFPDPAINIVIMPDTASLSIISPSGTVTDITPVDPQTDYDRAMGIIK